jgi:hypothetical protein
MNIMIIILSIIFFLNYQNVFCQTEYDVVSSTITEEEFTIEEEQQLEELYQEIDKTETETVTTSVEEDAHLYQEEDGFLESLLQNPLDINTATYLQLKSLPGITAELARKIIYQRKTKPFQSKIEVKEILGEEIYEKSSSYFEVYKTNQSKKLNGQISIKFYPEEKTEIKTYYQPTEKFKQPYYFYNRTQISYNDKLSLGYVLLHKPNEIIPSTESFDYLLRKWWIKLNSVGPFDKIIFGNYKAGFGYGMVLHENAAVESVVGSVKPKMRGLREDKGTADNSYLYGFGLEGNIGGIEYAVFYSQKSLIVKTSVYTEVTTTETGKEQINYVSLPIDDLLEVRNVEIDYDNYLLDYDVNIETSTIGKLPKSKVQEQLLGINFLFPIYTLKIGFCGYHAEYDKPFDPDKSKVSGYNILDKYSEKWGCVYRGDRLAVGSLYFELPVDKLTLFGEAAQSNAYFSQQTSTSTFSQQGYAVNLGLLLSLGRTKFYLLYTYLEPNFYSPLGIPTKIYDYPNNQHGIKIGNNFKFKNGETNISYGVCELFRGIWNGYSGSEQPRFLSRYNELFFDIKYYFLQNLEVYFRTIDDLRERYINLKTYDLSSEELRVQTQQLRIKNKYQISTIVLKDISLRFSYDQQWQKFLNYGKTYYGEQLWAELKYKFWRFTITSKFCIFNSDDNVYLSYLEPQWYNSYILENEEGSTGDKFYFTISYKIAENKIVLVKYKYKFYTSKIINPAESDYRIQINYGF